MLIYILMMMMLLSVGGIVLFVKRGVRWGATDDECAHTMSGDHYLEESTCVRVVMTRAISIYAPSEVVWPWLVQLGRGAGWYSIDRLDNGGKMSAKHLISWIPEAQIGDASAVGYLKCIKNGRELVWCLEGEKFLGARLRMVFNIYLISEGNTSRLLIRISSDAAGMTARPVLWFFQFIDCIMARRQLYGIKERVERYRTRTTDPENPENGARDQYQLYEVIYASGQKAGVIGKEKAQVWRHAAIKEGLIATTQAADNSK